MSTSSSYFASHPVFDRDEFVAAHDAMGGDLGPRAAERALDYHVRAGHLLRVRRRLFAVVPPGQAAESFRVDPYLVASRVAADGALAFHTALELHGVAQSVLRTVTVYSLADVRPTEFQGIWYRAVKPRASLPVEEALSKNVMTMNRQGLDLRVTDLERTVVDCLDRLELCGGWEEVQRSLAHVRVLDAGEATTYALQLGKASVAAKLGLFLHARREDLFVEDEALDRLTAALPAGVLRVERGHPGPYRTVPRWRLSVPAHAFDPAWAELS